MEEDLDGAQTFEPLTDLVEKLLLNPELSSPSSIRFATVRMRQHSQFDQVNDFADNAMRMPHGSPALARLFRDSDFWRDMQEWFVDYEQTGWGKIDWAVAQFGRMFPTGEKPSQPLVDHMAECLSRGSPLALTALAAQRLAAWTADSARQVIRARMDAATHPLERRVLALAALSVQEEPGLIRALLDEYEENSVTLRMIEQRDFQPLPVKPDFSGD